MIRGERAYPFMIFGISFLLGCIFFSLSTQYQQVHDAMVYIQYAQNIASDGLWKCGMHKEPGYSILIAPLFLIFSSPTAIMWARVLNIILVAGSSLIFYSTIRVLLPAASIKRIFIFSLLFALSPQLSSFSALRVYTEPLQLFLNSIILFCLIKISVNKSRPWQAAELKFWVMAALGAGWLMITKSFFLVYPLWIVFFVLIHRIFFCKISVPIKVVAKPVIIFLCISFLIPLLWSARNYKKFGYFMVAGRGAEVLLCHTYLVEWNIGDSFKWGVFQVSDSLGRFCFPKDAARMAKVTGEPYIEAQRFLNARPKDGLAKNDFSALREWTRLVKEHPFNYAWFYFLNSLNHILFEGIYPDIFPVVKTGFIYYVYLIVGLLLHFLYSILIWMIIIGGILKFAVKSGGSLLRKLELKYAIIAYSLAYFIVLAYHLHTEIRYFHPFYINVYLLFAVSYNYLFKGRCGIPLKGD